MYYDCLFVSGVMPGGRVPDRRIPGRSMNGDLQSSLYDEEDDRYRLVIIYLLSSY